MDKKMTKAPEDSAAYYDRRGVLEERSVASALDEERVAGHVCSTKLFPG